MSTLTGVVPVYNEFNYLETSINNLINSKLCDHIIIVDDCSNDGSYEKILNLYASNTIITILRNENNLGKGSALNLAFKEVNTSHVVIHDADLEYNPEDIAEMKILSHTSPKAMILGSRFIGKMERKNLYLRTYIANNVMSQFFSLVNLYKVTDVATCYKLMPAEFVKSIKIKEKGFSIEIELISKFLKFNKEIKECPISYNGRSYEEGKKIKTIDGFKYLVNTLKYRFFN